MKIIYAIYFAVLFLILGSYLLFMSPDNAIRLHIATADKLSETQSNAMMVWASDINKKTQFQGYKLTARWVKKDLNTPVAHPGQKTEYAVKPDGETVISIPELPRIDAIRQEAAALEVDLYDLDGKIQKSGFLPAAKLLNPIRDEIKIVQEPVDQLFSINAPAAFMFNAPNQVWITAFDTDGPYRGNVRIEQIHGPKATFPSQIDIHGVGSFPMSIEGTSDFKVTAGDHVMYATFVPNEKPLHASINHPNVTAKDGAPTVTVTPVGGMPTITVDYFQDGAWLERQVFPPHKAARFSLVPNYVFSKSPELLYARISTSSMGTPDSTQMFALIAHEQMMSIRSQASFAIKKLEDAGIASAPFLARLLEKDSDNTQAPLIRNYALQELAAQYIPNLEVKVRTETDEAKAFERRKARQKSTSNYLLIFWFGVGIVGSLSMMIFSSIKRRRKWAELQASGRGEVGQLPQQTTSFHLLCIVVLFIGLMIALFYMMQII